MGSLRLSHPTKKIKARIAVSGSKSESNRVLILKHLYFRNLQIENLSDSNDTMVLQKGLADTSDIIDVEDAGTAMRFLTAFFALQENRTVILQGNERMHQRPIGILVDVLKSLGAQIEYLNEEGFPPLQIIGKKLRGGAITIDGSVSSQFISALMMIAPLFEKGLQIKVDGLSVSTPYIYLTGNLMNRLGLEVSVKGTDIAIANGLRFQKDKVNVEPDWSSASYWFLLGLLANEAEIYLPYFSQASFQGDAQIRGLFEPLGIDAHYIGSGYRLKKGQPISQKFELNLIHTPDLAQTLAVAFAAKGIPATLSGLQTLRIKETDRLLALKTELEKTGAIIEIGDDFLQIKQGVKSVEGISFETYGDHRMAMALAPLALIGSIEIVSPVVVNKSYPNFWNDLEYAGFKISSLSEL